MKTKVICMKKIIILILLVMPMGLWAQQLPRYSQYMFNMININPAYTGNREVPNVNMLLRRQWVNFPGAPFTGTFTFDKRVVETNNSWGAQLYTDGLGIERTNGLQGFYAFSAPFENATLSIGTSFGVLNYSINYNRSNPYDAGDPSLQQSINGWLPSFGIGALYMRDRFYIGLSSPALLKTAINSRNQTLIRQAGYEGHFFLNSGYIFPISELITLKPSILLTAVSGAPIKADINMNVWLGNDLGFGISYRQKESVVGLLEYQLSPQLRIGYSYDHTTSRLGYYQNGTHELMLRMEMGGADKKLTSPRYY